MTFFSDQLYMSISHRCPDVAPQNHSFVTWTDYNDDTRHFRNICKLLQTLNCWCRGSQIILTGVSKPQGGPCEELDCEARIQRLEERWQELNALPTNSEMFRRLKKFREQEQGITETDSQTSSKLPVEGSDNCPPGLHRSGQPMSELWHAMQLLTQVENNTEGITRVCTSWFLLIRLPNSAKSSCHFEAYCYGVVWENSQLWYKMSYNTRTYNKQ